MKSALKLIIAIALLVLIAKCQPEKHEFKNFITTNGNKLMDGENEFRFISFNIPNLNFTEDEMAFAKPHAFRLPTSFEIKDALTSIKQIGGQVARTYTFPVRRESDTLGIPRYVLGPGQFDEESFKVMDTVLATANEVGVRLIVSLLNNWKWMGGVPQYAGFRGKDREAFWSDPELISDFKKTVEFVLNRTNTVSGIKYKDDKSIMCWETGNELVCPYSWTKEIVTYIKSIDTNHLVMDGYHAIDGNDIPEESINDDLIDIVTTHHYKLNPEEILKDIRTQMNRVNNKKPYVVGEFGFLGTEAIGKISDFLINSEISGGLIWSLRFHREEGGFYWHSEPLGDDIYKAFHWPGFPSGIDYNEEKSMPLIREKAFEIRGLKTPLAVVPEAPLLLPIKTVSEISWQGSTGAAFYDVERKEKGGDWEIAAFNITDASQTYTALFNDTKVEVGKDYSYRVIAKNESGESDPSNEVGPVTVNSIKFIDDMENLTSLYFASGDIKIKSDHDREFKEILHRLEVQPNSFIIYYVPGKITNVTCNAFSLEDAGVLDFSFSANGSDFINLSAERKAFYIGKGDYNYWIPSQHLLKPFEDYSYLKIDVKELSQIGRIEIDYVPTN
ncbi:MAG: hypothetical protein K9J12_17070 [Melioribacteraceae bacterium]|nr:hypothetical protein [Melioribacteraceae bacterium]MCF8265169.1 hypothetical protein [Melioribacteraceae bacterium]MCF8431775.1 hypothetical protein [Melioribacteraceae bacterium]